MLSKGSAVPIEMHWGETRRVSLGNAGKQRHAGRAAATHCWNPRRKLLLKCSNVGTRASIEMGETNELGQMGLGRNCGVSSAWVCECACCGGEGHFRNLDEAGRDGAGGTRGHFYTGADWTG